MTATYNVVAVLGAFLAVYVMQKTEHDKTGMEDHAGIQWSRRAAFVAVAFLLLYSVFEGTWTSPIVVLSLVSAGVCNLFVNAVALHRREAPPSDKVRRPAKVRAPIWPQF